MMGDRGIVVMTARGWDADLAVYSHYYGSELRDRVEEIVASTAFQSRVGDETYAARIMIDQLTKAERDSESGWGVYPVLPGANPAHLADGQVEVTVDLTSGAIT